MEGKGYICFVVGFMLVKYDLFWGSGYYAVCSGLFY